MEAHCAYCFAPLPEKRPDQRFCPAPSPCRSQWHKENTPGIVKVCRMLKGGGWSLTIHCAHMPKVDIGAGVYVMKQPEIRTDAVRAVPRVSLVHTLDPEDVKATAAKFNK